MFRVKRKSIGVMMLDYLDIVHMYISYYATYVYEYYILYVVA